MRIGIDTGGTFTDFVGLDDEGLVTHKARSTPDDPSRALLDGLTHLMGATHRRVRRRPSDEIVHGSTVATNAVLEGHVATVALVTTSGFEDVIRIGRQTRPSLYDLFVPPPPTLVRPDLVFGVAERLDAQGAVLAAPTAEALEQLAAAVAASGADIAAVCLLHAYANPVHERLVASRLRAHGVATCLSSEVLAEYREFERATTTVVNAAVTPIMDRYLARLEAALGATTRLMVMQSNGGTISATAARAQAIRTVLSGPAGGAVGARAVAEAAGFNRLIAFDMGGTSTDVSLIDGAVPLTTETTVGTFPVRIPVIDIYTIGAGGGSIAWIDDGGALRVGPGSAGAVPGPACYGSGEAFTVTDANVLLGRLDRHRALAGALVLDSERAHVAAVPLAERLHTTVPALAEGVVRVANANMERALRVVSVERGHDPRSFTLLAFGGAGGMHACDLADALSVRRVIIPRHAGVLSALGMLMTDVTREESASVLRDASQLSRAELDARFRPLVERARAFLRAEGYTGSRADILRALDVRYAGQSYELTVPHGAGSLDAFHAAHARTYGYADAARPVEIVNVRVTAIGRTRKPTLPKSRRVVPRRAVPSGQQAARFAGRTVRASLFEWGALAVGMRARGPAVVSGEGATAVVPPSWAFRLDAWGNLVCTRRSR